MTSLLVAEHVTKSFLLPDGSDHYTVLENVSVNVRAGEVVALLGRSGCGKSTLLRILAGLIAPTEGRVLADDAPLTGPNPNVAMVFQSFALLPWLTVQENAELGLTARGVAKEESEAEAIKALRMVGLEGFENAYPRELSGGMRQRVGFARAFVMHPEVLMMDEPFSALDVLTAENLRGEISELWEAGRFPAKSILLVTHNIEEAVTLSDRVIVLAANPGRVRGELMVDLPRPRDTKSGRFKHLVDHIYTIMTNPEAVIKQVPGEEPRFPSLPHARAGGISGLLEMIVDHGGRDDLPQLAERLRLEVDDLLPIVDAAVMLGLAEVAHGDVMVTNIGAEFAQASQDRSKEIFREQLLRRVPIIQTIVEALRGKNNGKVKADLFLDILDEFYSSKEAQRQFATAVDWGRYAKLFEYDADEEILQLPED
ncbi:MAG: Taurine-transporting ATPase [Bryobacterales bacterium]|nr:Taurine-transporting ATPase [Bryobacterales bacterium]